MATTSDKPDDRYPDSEGPFAGPGNSFPLNTAARVRSAWSRIHQAKVIANHSAAEIAEIRTKINAAAKKFGITLPEHGDGGGSVSSLERMVTAGAVEIRSSGAARKTVGGYAARFGARSREMSFGFERVDSGFFSEQAKAAFPNTMARWNHEPTLLLGTTSSGTLRLSVDSIGLDFSVDLPECRADLFELIGRGDVANASFCFVAAPDGGDSWSYENGSPVRTLLRCAQLVDVAPVGGSSLAAYPSATVALRSLARHCDASEEEIRALADRDELRKLFCDSRRTLTVEQAQARVEALRRPASGRPTLSPQMQMLHLYMMGRRWPVPPASRQARELARLRNDIRASW
jgi:HK97 family phage prohead protease